MLTTTTTDGTTWTGARRAMNPSDVSAPRKRRRGGSSTRAGLLRARERGGRAFLMRMAGGTYDQIAITLGFNSRQAARAAVASASDRIGDNGRGLQPRRFFKALIVAALEALLTAFFDRALAGDHRALSATLAITDRLDRLHGH